MPRFRQESTEPGSKWSRWVRPVVNGYRMACCDCGLVHTMEFRIEDDRVEFRVCRNNRSTAAIRRHMKVKA